MITEILVPSLGESIQEVTFSKWLVADGAFVQIDQPIAELESEKATQELTAEVAGYITHCTTEGATLKIHDLIAKIDSNNKNTTQNKNDEFQTLNNLFSQANSTHTPLTEQDKTEFKKYEAVPIHATPLAKQMIDDGNIDISQLKATGTGNKITKNDVLSVSQLEANNNPTEKIDHQAPPQNKTLPLTPVTQQPQFKNSIDSSIMRQNRPEKISNIRRTISKRLVDVKNSTAMLTTFNEVDMQAILDIRKKYKEKFKEKHNVSLGFMSFFLKAAAQALIEFPAVNAYFMQDQIIYHNYVDISVAVSTTKGLTVPVVRNVHVLSMAEIEMAVAELAEKAKNNKISLDDLTGGTFTVSNGGIFGSLMSTPIINPPQSAILGMHKIQERPVVVNSKIEIKQMMYVALSYDHRIIDGKDSVGFLIRIKELLENPILLLVGKDPISSLLEL
ncbi:MAG: 2-oxoglutarate dehydrogenase complex dihydrolipoyllysine-residue succinyltransferase [Alphaproteobacteria bacterium]|nr:2-oxoglutarate dehydrogenase complex dihydrolipoyllysine-residue succinyltransferase [Alphaproteobacteria bacterium]